MDKIAPYVSPETKERNRSLMLRAAERVGMDPGKFERTLMSTIIPNGKATQEQVAALLMVAERHKLDPWTKEIYAFPSKSGGITPIVGVDGWVTMMNREPQFDGVTFAPIERDDGEGKTPQLYAITCRIYRKDRTHPIEVTEYMDECARGTEPWRTHPRRMLRHKALIQCARVAFGFTGIHDPDEGERIVEAEAVEEEKAVVAEVARPGAKKKAATVDDLIPKEEPAADAEPDEPPEVLFDDLALPPED